MINYKAIGKRIKYYRKLNNFTQEQFSELISISTEHLSRIETGSIHLSLNLIQIICEKIGCSEKELMFGSDLLTDEDKSIYEKIKQLSPEQKQALTTIIDAIAEL